MNAPRQLPLALRLRPASSLSSFIEGDNAALLATLASADVRPGQLFLWGTEGSGRTHLLEACVRDAGEGACLLAGTELAALDPALLEGLEHYRLLAIDDIDQLAGQRHWEEALFHLYNRQRETGAAMLFSARQPPGECGFALADLASRLAAGAVWRVWPLADEGLMTLLRQRGQAMGLEVSDEVARYLMSRVTRSAAALVELLEQLDQQALSHQRRLTVPFIRSLGLTKL